MLAGVFVLWLGAAVYGAVMLWDFSVEPGQSPAAEARSALVVGPVFRIVSKRPVRKPMEVIIMMPAELRWPR